MNLEVANRLQQLRKAKGLSQEELANILGLSRQAISKWERAETSPDTDNLICLARLYNISIDKLLDISESTEEIKERIAQERINEIDKENETLDDEKSDEKDETIEEVEAEIVDDNIELTEEEKKLKEKRDEITGNICVSSFILGVLSYIIVARITDDWSWGWQFILIGMFGGWFISQLFVDRTFSGISLVIAVMFAVWVLSPELTDDTMIIIGIFILGGMFLIALIPIITYARFNMKNRKELELMNQKEELIRLQAKCKMIIEANDKYKQELKNINK